MNRDQMIAHLSLLGWEPVASLTGGVLYTGGELRLLNRGLQHNVWGGSYRRPWHRLVEYHATWGGASVEHLWKSMPWVCVDDEFLAGALGAIEGHKS